MDARLLLCAPNLRPSALATLLHRPPLQAADATWDLAAILRRLREKTEIHARLPTRPWSRPEPPPWVDATLAGFSPILLRSRFPSAQRILLLHPGMALHYTEIKGWLSCARATLLLRDGLVPPDPLPAGLPDPEAALLGLRWAERWAAHVGPALDAHVPTVSLDPPGSDLTAVLGLPGLSGWRLPPTAPLTGAAAEGFACHGPARRWMAHLGHPLPAPAETRVLSLPALAAAVAQDRLAQGEAAEAHAVLHAALGRYGEDATLWAVLGDLHAARGDEDAAVHSWREALRRPSAPVDAWLSLLSRPHRPETLAILAAARTAAEPRIRDAAARWLVARGLDPEAAEALANVHGRRWYTTTAASPKLTHDTAAA